MRMACLACFQRNRLGYSACILYNIGIVDALSATYPEMISDQKLGTARLCVSTILAKINTLEWTRLC